MSPPQSPWGPDDWPQNPALVLSQRQPTADEAMRQGLATSGFSELMVRLAQEQMSRQAQDQRDYVLSLRNTTPSGGTMVPPPQPLQEGRTPWQLNPLPPQPNTAPDSLMQEIDRLEDNRRRQQIGPSDVVERRQEKARKALGQALNEAVESGYMTEARAITMIVAGGLNDQPMKPAGALEQVTAALAQAVTSDAIDRATADSILAMIDRVQPAKRPSQGQTRPVAQPPERSEPSDQLARRDDLIYEALILRPCHDPAHENAHRSTVWICDEQAALAWRKLLDGLEISESLLPRQAHLDDTGERRLCCRQDGNIGTWLRWGRMTDPGLS